MRNADTIGATSVALDPEDQERLFRLATVYMCSSGELAGLQGAETLPRLEAAVLLRRGAEQATAIAEIVEATCSGSLTLSDRVRVVLTQALGEARDCAAMSAGYLAMVEAGEDPFSPPSRPGPIPLSTVAEELREQQGEEQADVTLLARIVSS